MARLLLSLVLVLITWAGPALAQEPELVIKKAALLPFPVLSKTPMDFLGQKVLQEFQERFQAEGLTLVPQEEINREVAALKEPLNETLAKEIGRKLGADVVVWGQLIIVGDALALEARILDITGKLPPIPMKVEGTGLKSLAGLNNRLAQEVALKIIGKERIANMEVKGNRRIEKDAILGAMQTREGEFLSPVRLREDLKSVYKMGYFTDVKLEVSDSPQGKILLVLVEEKPAIREIYIKGNRKIKEKDLREVMDLKPFNVASEAAIRENINKIVNLYREKGYYQAQVNYNIDPITKTEVNLVLNVDEGGKLSIKEIKFEGNKAFKAKELRKVMETKERDLLTWFTGSGRLIKDTLERDLEKVAAFYFNHGYIKARMGDPRVDIKDNQIYITIPVEEGPQYRMGKIDFQGDLLEEKEKMRERLEIAKEEVYSREVMQKDLTELADFYADHGYANADITPLIKEHDENRTVDVTFDIHQGNKVYFERIEIAGNIKTRDKVIRRELRVYEQELFSASKLKESTKSLRRLEYFEDVNFSTSPGSTPDRMNLKITVKERPTGSFGIGAGYSTQDRIVGMVEIKQNNLFGRGQQVTLQGIIGAISNRFRFSFTEPYLMDRPLAVGVDAFSWERRYDEYNRQNIGGTLRAAHPLRWQYTRLYGMYRFENVKLTDLGPAPAQALVEAARIHNTSAAGLTLRRDSRDAIFTPSRGSDNAVNVEMAGLGGDTSFLRYILESGWYYPLRWGTVGVLHGRIGYMQRLPWGELPVYEKFYLGGIDTIRGFKFAEISPRDPRTNDRVGGEKFVQLNTEYRFPIPLIRQFGFLGVVFFDAGNVYANNVNYFSSMRTSVGTGFRWFSPLGPLRVEWGYNLRPKPNEKTSNWEFTVGSTF